MIGRLKIFSLLIGLFGTTGANEFDEKTKQMLDWQWVIYRMATFVSIRMAILFLDGKLAKNKP